MKKLTADFGKTTRIYQNLILSFLFILLFSTNSTAHQAGISSINIKLNTGDRMIVHSTYARIDLKDRNIEDLTQKAFFVTAQDSNLSPLKTEFTENGHEINFRHLYQHDSNSDLTIRSLLPPSLSPRHQQIVTISRSDGKELLHQTFQGNYQFKIDSQDLKREPISGLYLLLIFASGGICLALGRTYVRQSESNKMTKATLTIANIGILILIVIYSIYNQNNQSVQANTEKPKVKIFEKDGFRHIESNGIPNHTTGDFPNDGNPNRIREQKHKFKVPLKPRFSPNGIQMPPPNRNREQRRRSGMPPPEGRGSRRAGGERGGPLLFGVALNGIPFDPGTAEAWNNDRRSGWNNEALTGKINLGVDINNAHVQPTGAYHYHGIPTGLIKKLADKKLGKQMVLIGYAADGFPVYSQYGYTKSDDAKSEIKKMLPSYRLKTGVRPDGPKGKYDGTYLQDFEYVEGLGDLDQCNGRVGITPEYPDGIYHYFITDSFPFIARCHRGIPDNSFRKGAPAGERRGRRPPPPWRPF